MVNDIEKWLEYELYGYDKEEKRKLLEPSLNFLTRRHNSNCSHYNKIISDQNIDLNNDLEISDIPFIPVRLFKEFELLSISKNEIFKEMTSSGTSGGAVSRIFLDKNTALNQTKVLSKLVSNVIGKRRLPMLIIDTPNVLKNRNTFSARGAGILGFSMFGKDATYALNDDMSINFKLVEDFCSKHDNSTIFIFGFTSIIWQHFITPMLKKRYTLPIKDGFLFHGGGWKNIFDQSVDRSTYSAVVKSVTNVKKVKNYYGMVEQTGSIFMECEYNHLHAPIYSDVIVRRSLDLSPANFGEKGVLEVLSMLPESYPGHALLTEDIGEIIGEDDCLCGKKGKYFQVHGRIEKAEIRGCSDTYQSSQ